MKCSDWDQLTDMVIQYSKDMSIDVQEAYIQFVGEIIYTVNCHLWDIEGEQDGPLQDRFWQEMDAAALRQPAKSFIRNTPKTSSSGSTIPKCTCDSKHLSNFGCKCGAFQAEQKAKNSSSSTKDNSKVDDDDYLF
jgi:hypothetical protein